MEPDPEFLDSEAGHKWLRTDEGTAWINTAEGIEWSRTAAGERFVDAVVQSGFEAYFAGEMPAPPDWMFTPETAPQIGSRVRVPQSMETIGGTSFKAGDPAIVDELRFGPSGNVIVRLRTMDGRKLLLLGGPLDPV